QVVGGVIGVEGVDLHVAIHPLVLSVEGGRRRRLTLDQTAERVVGEGGPHRVAVAGYVRGIHGADVAEAVVGGGKGAGEGLAVVAQVLDPVDRSVQAVVDEVGGRRMGVGAVALGQATHHAADVAGRVVDGRGMPLLIG